MFDFPEMFAMIARACIFAYGASLAQPRRRDAHSAPLPGRARFAGGNLVHPVLQRQKRRYALRPLPQED
ncbi:hypothetical protein AQZ50_16785 [Novosphingobium sp. Fuku2-ISO-50]|nr:hypothetical protein AQZ50_16785 [Novosphingobium sp. Fuku2-ISO-50]